MDEGVSERREKGWSMDEKKERQRGGRKEELLEE